MRAHGIDSIILSCGEDGNVFRWLLDDQNTCVVAAASSFGSPRHARACASRLLDKKQLTDGGTSVCMALAFVPDCGCRCVARPASRALR